MAEPDSATVRRAQAGDRDAITDLVTGQQRYVYSIAMSLVRDPAEAADLTQDAFVRLLRSLPTYRRETRFTTWLYRLVVNLGLDRLRRKGRPLVRMDEDPDFDLPGEDPLDDAARVVEREEEVQLVRRALDALPQAQRLALTLHYFDNLRYEDVADVMGVPLNTVKSHIRRGKDRLAGVLGPELTGTSPAGSTT